MRRSQGSQPSWTPASPAQITKQTIVVARRIRGFTEVKLEQKGPELFQRHKGVKDVLWVSAEERIFID